MRLPIQLEAIIFRRKATSASAGQSADAFEFLLLRRIPQKGGFWQPVSGGLEETDATKLDGVLREIREEASVEAGDILRVIEGVHEFVMKNHYITGLPIQDITEYAFGVEVRHEFVPRLDKNVYPEHDEWRWVGYDEAISMLKWQNNKDSFEKLQNILAIEQKR